MTGDTSSIVRNLQHDARLRIINKPINADELHAPRKTLPPSQRSADYDITR